MWLLRLGVWQVLCVGFLGLCASWYFASVWLGHRFLGLCGFGGFGWCFWFLVGDVWIVRFAVGFCGGFWVSPVVDGIAGAFCAVCGLGWRLCDVGF